MRRIALSLSLVLVLTSLASASVIEFSYAAGSTIYAVIRRPADKYIWDTTGTPAFEVFAAAQIANYDVALTADADDDYYTATFPAGIAAGTYTVQIYLRAGDNPAITDSLLGSVSMHSSGIEQVDLAYAAGTVLPVTNATVFSDSLVATTVVDSTYTIDDLFEALFAFMCGKVAVVDNGATRTISFYKRDGTTVKFNVTAAETDGSRAAGGGINP